MPKRGWVPWERIPPVHKQFKKAGCEWHPGVGWVWNPTHRSVK